MSDRPVDKSSGIAALQLEELVIDRAGEVPIGVQLAWALRSRIGDGRLRPGERLPALRDLAEAAGVNVNTARAVYQRLEHEGLIDSQQGSGTFVVPTARRASAVGSIVANAAREARETGVDPREVAAALYVSLESAPDSLDAEAERRRLLRTQIAALERALGEMQASHPGLLPPPSRARGGIGPALLSAEELEQVRTVLVRRLSSTQAAIDAADADAAAENAIAGGRPKASARRASSSGGRKAELDVPPEPKRASRPPRPRPATAGT
jgi:DNA-binding transcriptional regulator YhcF (GntR family)